MVNLNFIIYIILALIVIHFLLYFFNVDIFELFDKKKNKQPSQKKIKRNSTKEIKFRPTTDIGDFQIKLKKIKNFINSGDRTKISVRFRGREILNSNMGLDLLEKVRVELEDTAQVDQEPSLEGKQLLMVLTPLKRK